MKRIKSAKSKSIILFGVITFACSTICVVSIQLFINGCLWWECAPKRNFDVLSLGIPLEISPGNSIHRLRNDSIEVISLGFQDIYSKELNDVGNYVVERYSKLANASEAYQHGLHLFIIFETQKPWERPNELSFEPQFADESIIGCGLGSQNDHYRCIFQARYQEFLILINCGMGQDMTYQDFQKIIIFIDQRMEDLLEKH